MTDATQPDAAPGVESQKAMPLPDPRPELWENYANYVGALLVCAQDNIAVIDALLSANREMEEKIAENQASFDLRWKADMRGIKRWQDEKPTERELKWPDHADLVVWLLDKLDAVDSENAKGNARWLWAKPILQGDDTPEADARMLVVAAAAMTKEPLDSAVDRALAAIAAKGQK